MSFWTTHTRHPNGSQNLYVHTHEPDFVLNGYTKRLLMELPYIDDVFSFGTDTEIIIALQYRPQQTGTREEAILHVNEIVNAYAETRELSFSNH